MAVDGGWSPFIDKAFELFIMVMQYLLFRYVKRTGAVNNGIARDHMDAVARELNSVTKTVGYLASSVADHIPPPDTSTGEEIGHPGAISAAKRALWREHLSKSRR